jgi:hypothetical protein
MIVILFAWLDLDAIIKSVAAEAILVFLYVVANVLPSRYRKRITSFLSIQTEILLVRKRTDSKTEELFR